MPTWLAYSMVTIALWGVWGVFSKIAAQGISPGHAKFWHFIGLTISTTIVFLSIGLNPSVNPKGIMFSILSGLSGGTAEIFFFVAMKYGKASIIVPLTALYPIVTAALAMTVLGEPVTVNKCLGIVVAIIAMGLLSK